MATTSVVRTHIVDRKDIRDMFGCIPGDNISVEWVSGENPYLKVIVTESKKDESLESIKHR